MKIVQVATTVYETEICSAASMSTSNESKLNGVLNNGTFSKEEIYSHNWRPNYCVYAYRLCLMLGSHVRIRLHDPSLLRVTPARAAAKETNTTQEKA